MKTRSHSQIVRDAGAPEEVAALASVSVNTVRSWIGRDSIPADKWALFSALGHATLEELAFSLAARKAAA